MVFSMAAEIERGLIRDGLPACLSDGRKAPAKASWTKAPSENRGAACQRVHPEVHRELKKREIKKPKL